jgi:hypothetical protein
MDELRLAKGGFKTNERVTQERRPMPLSLFPGEMYGDHAANIALERTVPCSTHKRITVQRTFLSFCSQWSAEDKLIRVG